MFEYVYLKFYIVKYFKIYLVDLGNGLDYKFDLVFDEL